VLAGALLAVAVAAPVLAHAELVASDPADKAVLAIPPTTVTVTFSEAIDPDRSRFKLVGPDGTVGTGRIADDPAVLVLEGLDLGPGAYEIQWTAASTDGHIERGRLRFTVSAPTPAPPSAAPTATPGPTPSASAAPGSAGAPSAPAAGSPPPSADASPTPTAVPAEPAAGSTGSAGDMLLPVVVATVVVAGVGLFVLRRSRRA
jgi:methionine-rich copper-binding protein CopC